jgi:glutamine amidotransferase
MSVALIDYGAGNLTSVKKALHHLDAEFVTPAAPAALTSSKAIIVPGVGNFEATAALHDGWRDEITEAVDHGVSLLGICLGLQWLFDGSAEAPRLEGLGLLAGTCALITKSEQRSKQGESGLFKVPHVGWNSLHLGRSSWLLDGVKEGAQVYFTHSFAAPVTDACVASTTHGIEFASVVERGSVAGVQFHPEKSGDVGLQILRNFLDRVNEVR